MSEPAQKQEKPASGGWQRGGGGGGRRPTNSGSSNSGGGSAGASAGTGGSAKASGGNTPSSGGQRRNTGSGSSGGGAARRGGGATSTGTGQARGQNAPSQKPASGGGNGGSGAGQAQKRDSSASIHAKKKSPAASPPPPGGATPPASADPSSAMNNLQHLIQDIKHIPPTASPYSGSTVNQSAEIDAQADLAAVGSRLAAQEEQLQAQLQQQLNLQTASAAGRGLSNPASSFGRASAAPGGLASLGEDVEVGQEEQAQAAVLHRQGGPRFAGNIAFQSAVARHAAQQAAQQGNQDSRSSLAHQRQLSLQGRFADLGYNLSGNGGLGPVPNEMDDMTDDGASSVDFVGGANFDPTRQPRQQGHDFSQLGELNHNFNLSNTSQSQSHGAHRRTGSDMSGMQAGRIGHMHAASLGGNLGGNLGGGNGMGPGSQLLAEQMALQQQIEMLQLQQQQLLQQHINFNPSTALGGQPQPGRGGTHGNMGGHRRIQSHAPQSGPMGSFSTNANAGGMGNFGLGQGQQGQSPASASSVPRGHGRRHSVNVVNKNAQANNASSPGQGSGMTSNLDFSFPPNNNGQQQQQQQQQQVQSPPPQQMQAQSPPLSQNASQQSHGGMGHFSHPSVQLQQSLSPEYLMAGGGLVSLASLGLGGSVGDLADGFGGAGGGGGRGGGHSRTGSANWRINGAPGQQVTDLAQAQAQLASLHQFRAQAGGAGGHTKTPSFGGGFNPGMMGAGNFQGGGGGFGGQFQSGGMQGGQQGNLASQRKALFGSYLPQASLPPLLAAGKLVVGMLRVNKRNRSDAYVSTEVLDSDIFISGSKDRNRALEGDLVAVELLDPNEVWSIKKEKEDKKKRKEEQGGALARKPDKAKDDLEVEGAQLKLIEDEEENEQSPPALAGHVVAIVERTPGQLFSGTLGLLRPSSAATKEKQQAERALREGGDGTQGQENQARPKIVWFRPTDKRVPLIAIPADQAPEDFWTDPDNFHHRLFVSCIKRWPITSLHPFGTLVEELGVIGNVEAETQALLKDSLSSATEEFGENALKCLPPLPFSIPEREYEVRRDFRANRVFSIDPPSAKDLDDALSITRLDGGLYEVGVHIADVSHFVKTGSALDRDARKRGTSVYLIQRAVPMLPPTLSEELCSLVPNVERLCFSAVFTMTKDARIIGTWLGRTIIKSCAKLAYSDAQQVIEGGSFDASKVHGHPLSEIEADIKNLHELAVKMRQRRFENGALKIDNVRLSFDLDEQGLPTDCGVYKTYDAHRLIEEFMLQANITVAQKIAAGLPDVALLRRHEQPIDRRLEGFAARAKRLGFDIDTNSGGALYKSLEAIDDRKARMALETLATKSMLRAKYFCTGMVDIAKYAHYALNVPLYTHFTSPIRRYADVMVHRQLDAVLQGVEKFPVDREAMAKIAQQCNVKKDAAKQAQEQSAHLFLCLLISDLTQRYGPVIRQATVIGVLDAAFDVVIPEFGVEKRCHVDQMPIEHHVYDEHSNSLSIYWKQGVDVIAWLAETSDDVHVKKVRALAEQHAMMEMTSQSHTDEAALFDDDDDDEEDGLMAARRRAMLSGEDAKDSVQRQKSFKKEPLQFEGLQTTPTGHRIQTVKELSTVPVIVTSDMTKSPPVLKVFSVNPFFE